MRFAVSPDYFRMNNNIFDLATDENEKAKAKLTAVQMRVLAVLYSVASYKTYRVKVRQSVLAQKCGCSVSTIKRAVSGLIEKGYICNKIRTERNDRLLGTYIYTLPRIAQKGYFYVSRKALAILNKTQTRVYLFICKCVRSNSIFRDCWNSFNDIAKQLRLHRNSVIKTIKELVDLKVIYKYHNTNEDASHYYDNTYVVVDPEVRRQNEQFIEEFFGEQEKSTVTEPVNAEVYENDDIQDLLAQFAVDSPTEKEELPLQNNDSSTMFENRGQITTFGSECTTFPEFCQWFTDTVQKIFSVPRAGP